MLKIDEFFFHFSPSRAFVNLLNVVLCFVTTYNKGKIPPWGRLFSKIVRLFYFASYKCPRFFIFPRIILASGDLSFLDSLLNVREGEKGRVTQK
jgi:hypothetical protein